MIRTVLPRLARTIYTPGVMPVRAYTDPRIRRNVKAVLARRSRKMREQGVEWAEPKTAVPRFQPQYDYPTYAVPNPQGVLTAQETISSILSQPTLVVERQIEMMNVVLGFEQANHYRIMDAMGNVLGSMRERDFGIGKMILRQVTRLHRPFLVDVFDVNENHIFTIRRPFSFINSHIKAILPGVQGDDTDGVVIGESIQSWHLWRRRYNLFKKTGVDNYDQFGSIDSGFLSFNFPVHDENGGVMGAVDRNWVGLGREMFTDTGVYVLRFDPASFQGMEDVYPQLSGPMALDQRAVMLGNAVSIDFDYFSRHSGRGGLMSFGSYE
ncbi:hypothetical protein BABINDRAFT_160794 [Babjeviella inositovora NRRL Y-12698]|uniref:Phospholipid scramblase n=1 Tax=Babjeviella inositovora NRRL Y-12698 TaxID=984486 RepID=A0A1E3QS48_9ASCO|nr:uncharacterized protein BABINDRAFT_160794 [Babjeviella inositovora NRRL Y-12698]ODQ80519.1 hypothetical protein BABINDRAFT_160794 [Babjeviella inositovora NRRL Y-12698]